jgi:adenosine deaminase
VGWLEIQVDPTSYAPALGGLSEALEAVLVAAADAPIPTGIVVASSWARSPEHAERLALLAERQISMEICPTSYPPLGVHELADAPIPSLLGAGVPVALASDDPLLFGVGLAGQYAIGREPIGLSDDELAAIAAHRVNASAAPAPVKRRLLAGVEDWRQAPDHP